MFITFQKTILYLLAVNCVLSVAIPSVEEGSNTQIDKKNETAQTSFAVVNSNFSQNNRTIGAVCIENSECESLFCKSSKCAANSTEIIYCSSNQKPKTDSCTCPTPFVATNDACVCPSGNEPDGQGGCQLKSCKQDQKEKKHLCICREPMRIFDKKCVTPVTCPPGKTLTDKNTCIISICSTGKKPVTDSCSCPTPFIATGDACVCPSGNEPDGQGGCQAKSCDASSTLVNGVCITKCTENQMIIPSFNGISSCICTAPMKIDSVSRKCKTPVTCPAGMKADGDFGKCLCSEGTEDNGKGGCRAKSCDASSTLVNGVCITKCTENQMIIPSFNGISSCICTAPMKIDSVSRKCKTPVTCPAGMKAEGDFGKCLCSEGTEDNGKGGCQLQSCKQDQNEKKHSCTCREPMRILDKKCVTPVTCPPGKTLTDKNTCKISICSTAQKPVTDSCSCPTPFIATGDACVCPSGNEPDGQGGCQAKSCDASSTLVNGVCITKCTENQMIIPSFNGISSCICTAPMKIDTVSRKCKTPVTCPAGMKANGDFGKCLCSEGTEDNGKGGCRAKSCDASSTLVNGVCITKCTENQMIIPSFNGISSCICTTPMKMDSASGRCKMEDLSPSSEIGKNTGETVTTILPANSQGSSLGNNGAIVPSDTNSNKDSSETNSNKVPTILPANYQGSSLGNNGAIVPSDTNINEASSLNTLSTGEKIKVGALSTDGSTDPLFGSLLRNSASKLGKIGSHNEINGRITSQISISENSKSSIDESEQLNLKLPNDVDSKANEEDSKANIANTSNADNTIKEKALKSEAGEWQSENSEIPSSSSFDLRILAGILVPIVLFICLAYLYFNKRNSQTQKYEQKQIPENILYPSQSNIYESKKEIVKPISHLSVLSSVSIETFEFEVPESQNLNSSISQIPEDISTDKLAVDSKTFSVITLDSVSRESVLSFEEVLSEISENDSDSEIMNFENQEK